MSNENSPTVLVADDEEDTRYAIARILRTCGCIVTEAESVENALEILPETQFDIVFSDMRFHGGAGGEELLEIAVQQYPETDIVLMSCIMDTDRTTQLMAQGASYCLQKPVFKAAFQEILEELHKPPLGQAA